MSIRENSLLFLLGAGASVDAGIMHAKDMTNDIEDKVQHCNEFKQFKDLYNFLKSSIIYQRGLEGEFNDRGATIEDLLNVLSDINLKHQNKLYPFIGSWNVHLLKVAGDDFEQVAALDKTIREQLFDWINIRNYDNAVYFNGFGALANEIGIALRVFTLNYDLCVENALLRSGVSMELGFNAEKNWEATQFDSSQTDDSGIYLYKLHGSIDWVRDKEEGHLLVKCDSPQKNPELIFGTTAKMSSIDPYLFNVHEFRKYSLEEPVRFIVSIGYSFSDDYINKLISQAMRRNNKLNLLTVSPSANSEDIQRIAKLLQVGEERVLAEAVRAREFFENKMNLEYFEGKLGILEDSPF